MSTTSIGPISMGRNTEMPDVTFWLDATESTSQMYVRWEFEHNGQIYRSSELIGNTGTEIMDAVHRANQQIQDTWKRIQGGGANE